MAKYRGKYKAIGWDTLRVQRFARQQKLGVLTANARLSPRSDDAISWDSVPEPDRDLWDLKMATYAAMIDRMDRNIGRILGKLDETGKSDNTVIFFLSDNGACADSKDTSTVSGAMPWEVTSYLKQGRHWANASNTPYRKYKTTDYEGGTRTPMIAYWPGVIEADSRTDHVGHLIDFTATMLDLAGAEQPSELPGHSLVPALKGKAVERPWPIYWQFNKAKAIRDRDWKLVKYGDAKWELYNVAEDPTELVNLSKANLDKVRLLAEQWQTWWQTKN